MKTKKLILCACLALCSAAAIADDTLYVRIKLKSVNDILAFNQSFVPDNNLEYSWVVLIDSDNNPSTGNTVGYGGNTGFDVALAVSHFKMPGSSPQSGSIVSNNTQKNTLILSGTQSTVANTISATIDYADSALVIAASLSLPELSGNNFLPYRFVAYTSYYSTAGIITDVSPVSNNSGPYTVYDALNDVDSAFVDIKELYVGGLPLGISEANNDNDIVTIFPNPFDGAAFYGKIENAVTGNEKDKAVLIKLHDMLGGEVFSNEIMLEFGKFSVTFHEKQLQQGMYIVTVLVDTMRFTQTVVIK